MGDLNENRSEKRSAMPIPRRVDRLHRLRRRPIPIRLRLADPATKNDGKLINRDSNFYICLVKKDL